MNNIIIIPIAVFYASYITKAILLKKKGLNANQLGLGQKELSTRLLEYFLIIITYTIIVVQSLGVFGIFNRTQIFKYSEILGIIIALIGNVFFILALVYMKNNWRAGIDSTQKTTLTTSGIFNISRNPAFLGFDLFYIGTSLALANIFLIILTVIALILFHLQILKEEKFLTITFEDDYLTYKKKSKALYLILQKIFSSIDFLYFITNALSSIVPRTASKSSCLTRGSSTPNETCLPVANSFLTSFSNIVAASFRYEE